MRLFVASLCVLGITCLGLWLYIKHERNARWEEAYWNARDAYKRAAEYKDSGVMWFEPRYRDLEISTDQLARTPHRNDDPRLTNLQVCQSSLTVYRSTLDLVQQLNSSAEKFNLQADSAYDSFTLRKTAAGYALSSLKSAQNALARAQDEQKKIDQCVDSGRYDLTKK